MLSLLIILNVVNQVASNCRIKSGLLDKCFQLKVRQFPEVSGLYRIAM